MLRRKPTPPPPPARLPSPPPPTWDERLIRILLPWRLELVGLLAVIVGFIGLSGLGPTWLGQMARQLAGWGIYPLFLSLALLGVHVVLRRTGRPFLFRPGQIIGFELMFIAALPLSYYFSQADLAAAYAGRGGGLLGWALAVLLLDFLGPVLTLSLYLTFFVWGLALVLQVEWEAILLALANLSIRLKEWAKQQQPLTPAPPQQVSVNRPGPISQPLAVPAGRDRRLPPLTLLQPGVTVRLSPAEIDKKKKIIEQTLRDFGLTGTVTDIQSGPAVTQFGVTPGYLERPGPDGSPQQYKVRISQIASLQRDFALALAVSRLRIEAPVPGRGIVGLEVPNSDIATVRLRAILESPHFASSKSPLTVALGQTVSGQALAIDLAKMPHLLIAGTTGSGKSVCLNAFISCLVFNNTPEQLRLVMIDPKKVELIRFNGLPHLTGRVEVEHERVIGVLRWLMAEMDNRYQAFAALGAKNLQSFNQKVSREPEGKSLPYIVVIIDELADLMAMYPADVERALCRLAQMARATGIHLVVATQRPSTDVITGLIKANFPARISFAVASSVDSRVILDSVGAEQLLGRGDMLFLSPEAGEPMRVQGCLVEDEEIEAIAAHWQRVMADYQSQPAPWESLIVRQEIINSTDDMLEQAIELAQKSDNLSTSMIQRRLRVGFPRAARIMEALYELGLVEDPQEGGRTRRSFVREEEGDPLERYISGRESANQ